MSKPFNIPNFKTRFAYNANALLKCEQIPNWMKWWEECSNMSKAHFDNGVGDTPTTVAYFYPLCDNVDRFENLTKIVAHLFVWDDHTEIEHGDIGRDINMSQVIWKQYEEMCNLLSTGDGCNVLKTTDWKPYTFASHAVVKSIFKESNRIQQGRILEGLREFMNGSVDETILIMKNEITFDEIVDIRLRAGANKLCINLIEYANDIFVSEAEWSDPTFQRLCVLANKAVLFWNDIVSFNKELKQQNGKIEKIVCNSVASISKSEKITIELAMDKVLVLVKHIEEEIHVLSTEMFNKMNTSEALKTFITGLQYFVSGNYRMSQLNARYRV